MFSTFEREDSNKFDLEAFVDACMQEMAQKNQRNIEDWGLGNYDRWNIDQATGKLTFSNTPENGGETAICDFQIVGTYSNVSHSWLWAWDNQHIDQRFAADSRALQDLGKAHGVTTFVESFHSDQDPGWEFAAIAGKLSNAAGCYRGPINGNAGFIYMTFSNVTQIK